jgi:cytochrome P450
MNTTGKLPPGPKGLFLIGNALAIMREPFDFPLRCLRDYGGIVRLRFGSLVFYLVSDPAAIEQVLRHDHRYFIKDKGTRMLSAFLGEGLLTSEGDVWRRQRRLAQPAFQLDQVQKYGGVMTAFAERMLQDWRPGQTRDVHADMNRLTMEIAAQTFLGVSVAGESDRVGTAMTAIMEHFAGWAALVPWLQRLPTPGNRRYRRAVRVIDAVMYDAIARRRAGGASAGDDLLSRLLALRDEDGTGMSDRQLRDELVTLFLAGHETTALALSFTFYLLAQHPEAETRLAAEVDEILQGRRPTAADVPRLRYADWVIKESMRLYPPAPAIGREAVCDCEIGGYHVPKGTQVSLVQWTSQRDARWFDDPEVFRPERWDNDLARRLPRGAYFPFGDGPRICIGNQFALLEAVLVLATVAQRYRLALAPGFKLELLPSVTLRPKHGVVMVVQARPERRDLLDMPASPAVPAVPLS